MKEERSFGIIPIIHERGDSKFLLVQHTAGHWAFPKGHAELHETEQETALRELREETGITNITLLPCNPIEEVYKYSFKGEVRNKTVRYYIGECRQTALILDPKEISDAVWLTEKDARDRLSFDGSRHTLQHAVHALSTFYASQG